MTRVQAAARSSVIVVMTMAVVACGGGGEQAPSAATSLPPTAAATVTSTAATTTAQSAEQAAAQAATTAFTELLRATNAARRDPLARDWEPEIRRYAADPAAYLAVQSVARYATLGLRQLGDSQVDVQVSRVDLGAPEGPSVVIAGCFDSQSSQVAKVDTGEVIPSGTPSLYLWDVTVIQYQAEPGQPWLVSTLQPRTDTPC